MIHRTGGRHGGAFKPDSWLRAFFHDCDGKAGVISRENFKLKESSSKVVLRNSAFGFASQISLKILSFIFSVVVVRQLGPEAFGQYTAAAAFGTIFLFVADLGLSTFSVREVARMRNRDNAAAQVEQLYGNLLALRILLSLLAAVMILITAWATGRPLFMMGAIALNALGIIFYAVQASSAVILGGYERFGPVSSAAVIQQVVFVALGALALWMGWGMYGLIVSALVGIVVLSLLTLRAIKTIGINPAKASPSAWPALLRASLPFAINTLALGLSYKFDTILLEVTRSSTETGLYNVAYNLVLTSVVISNVVNTALYPSLSRRAEGESLTYIYERLMRYLLALSIPLAVGGFMLSPHLLEFLYGARNAGALPAFQVLVWVIPLQYVSEFLGYVVLVKGHERLATRSLLISTSCNVLINLFLVPRYGFMAAAVVTVATEAVLVLQYLWILRSEIRQFDLGMVLLRPLLAAAGVFLALAASQSLPFLAQLAVGVVVGGSCLLLLRVFGRQELQMILRMRAQS